MKDAINRLATEGGKLLTFNLGKQHYGIEIGDAREVVGMMPIDRIPGMSPWVKGVINLRGKIIPVIDLAAKFYMEPSEPTQETCIVVVDVAGRMTGVIVDFLSGVITIQPEQFEESPELTGDFETDFIAGIAKLEGHVLIVLKMQRILENSESFETSFV